MRFVLLALTLWASLLLLLLLLLLLRQHDRFAGAAVSFAFSAVAPAAPPPQLQRAGRLVALHARVPRRLALIGPPLVQRTTAATP